MLNVCCRLKQIKPWAHPPDLWRPLAKEQTIMEILQIALEDLHKKIEMLRGRQRRLENGQIMWPGKKMITMLALLEGTRDSIAIIMALPRNARIAQHLTTPLSFEQICATVQDTLLHWPGLLDEAQSNKSHIRLNCQRQLHECRTSMWLVEQNSKGIAIVPRLAMEYYIRLWGQSPYTELVTGHLVRFSNPISTKKWFRAFRINWGFHYAKLAMECALSNSDIDRKVATTKET